ncbi:hypothetical protein OTB20_25055 [Streptomyces sp. H27-H1]|uniref:hypothetical protein n=1 Tax=Streptomyces sp. H27-H1 TaxID=2996461 RepID=UPI002271CDBB|nr:hypothetical protein [Streptomyces sp. H27-H1]MCY0929408.1 hypothetical protein [Streptomyces sp. H27-H1]
MPVAGELPGALSGEAGDPVPAALVRLTCDETAYVREQAAFALGRLAEVDGPGIRAALWRCVEDVAQETREEGVRGLAVRRDPGVRAAGGGLRPAARCSRSGRHQTAAPKAIYAQDP